MVDVAIPLSVFDGFDGFCALVFFKKPAIWFSFKVIFLPFEVFLFSTERIIFFVDAFFFPFDLIFLTREAIFLSSKKTIFSLIQTKPSLFVRKTTTLEPGINGQGVPTTCFNEYAACRYSDQTIFNANAEDSGVFPQRIPLFPAFIS